MSDVLELLSVHVVDIFKAAVVEEGRFLGLFASLLPQNERYRISVMSGCREVWRR